MGVQGGDVVGDSERERKKKLIAGVRFSLRANTGSYQCSECDAKRKKRLNCQNHQGVLYPILNGPDDWRLYPPERKWVEKVWRTKFFACPLSTITQGTWELIRLANQCLSGEGDAITVLPFGGGLLEQPPWFREAMDIIRSERAEYRREQLDKLKTKK